MRYTTHAGTALSNLHCSIIKSNLAAKLAQKLQNDLAWRAGGNMAFEDREKLDRVLNELVLEVQSWARENFKYAMARSNIVGEISGEVIFAKEEPIKKGQEENKSGEDVAELVFVMGKKPGNFALFSNRITKLVARYRRKYNIIFQLVFQWEEEDGQISASENRTFNVDSIIMDTYKEG